MVLELLAPAQAEALVEAKRFLSDLLSLVRLSAPGGVITDDAPVGLKRLLVEGMHVVDFDRLKETLLHHEAQVRLAFAAMEAQTLLAL